MLLKARNVQLFSQRSTSSDFCNHNQTTQTCADLFRFQRNLTVTHCQIRLFENGDRIDLIRTASHDPLAVAYLEDLKSPKTVFETICCISSRTCSFRFFTATILSVLISTAHASRRVLHSFEIKSLRECSKRLFGIQRPSKTWKTAKAPAFLAPDVLKDVPNM